MADYEVLSPSSPVSMHEDWFEIATIDHFWMQWRFDVFNKLIKNKYPLGNKIFEIGCGPGTFREQVEQFYNIKVDGCDLNSNALSIAQQGKGRIMQYNIFDKNPELIGKYDSIFLMDVVEHLDDDSTFLKAAAAHGKPGAYIFINVPAGMYLHSKYDEKVGHVRRYNKKSMQQTISNAGLQQVELSYWAGLLIPLGIIRKIMLTLSSDNENTIKNGFKPPGKLAAIFLQTLRKIEVSVPFAPLLGASLFAIVKVPD